MSLHTLVLASLLAGCGGEEPAAPATPAAPAAPAAEPAAAIDLSELKKEAEQVSLVPSPTAMQEALKKAGINETLESQVQVRDFVFDGTKVNTTAVKTGVALSDALLTVRTAPPDVLVKRLQAVKAGMEAIKAGGDIGKTIDSIVADIQAVGTGPRDGIEQQLEELHAVILPELEFEAGEQIVPLILAGGWLEGSNLVTASILKANKPAAGNELLRQGPVCDYFLKYLDAAEKANTDQAIVGALRTTLTKLKEVSAKPEITEADVREVKAQTDLILGML